MRQARFLATLVASFAIGGASVLLAAPSSAHAALPCANVACAFNQEQGLWCQFVEGHSCSMSDPRHCNLSSC